MLLKVPFKDTITPVIILLALAKCCESRQQSVLEGEGTELVFPYPCDSTEVTLQRGSGYPLYSSANPDAVSDSNKLVTNHNHTKSDNCSLHLVINPVSRNDLGAYILLSYNGEMPLAYYRIWLEVNYPPGKASCKTSSEYNETEWVTLECKAEAGNLAGQIVCYQNGTQLPPSNPPQDNDMTIHQIFLARLSDYVYCCSSFFEQTMAKCECKDWGWDFTDNRLLTNIHPCASASTTQSPTSFQMISDMDLEVDIKTSLPMSNFTTTLTQPPLIQRTYLKWLFVIACIFMAIFLVTTIIFGVCACKYKQKAQEVRIYTERQKGSAYIYREQEQVNFV